MEGNNNQSTSEEISSKSLIVEKLKQIRKRTLYIWITILAVLVGSAAILYYNQSEKLAETYSKIESLEEKISQLNDDYDDLLSENEELECQLEEYQNQQETIDELNIKLSELQKQHDTLKTENEKFRAENETLKAQVAEKEAALQALAQQNSSSGGNGMRVPERGYSDSSEMVWLSETGSKYHSIPDCGRMNPNNAWQVSRSSAEAQGYDACKKCY